MKLSDWILSGLVISSCWIPLFGGSSTESPPPRPNILFCLADDWGWPHAGAYGDTGVLTPTFDRLAQEGVLFRHAYVSSPSCTPSRNAFLTGKYHWQLGSGANLWSELPVEHQSFIHILRDNGYVTGRNQRKTWGPGNIEPWIAEHGDHPGTTAYADFKTFLDETDAGEQPFFFWIGTSDPHRPYDKDSGRDSGIDLDRVHLFEHFPDNDLVRGDVADYYYEVQRWDRLVGSAVEELEKRGLLENTVIIMTGDHGMPFPRGKGNLYDSGVRVPFAVRWGAGIEEGRDVEDFISFADIAPTLLELATTPVPDDMSGLSFAGILRSSGSGLLDPGMRSSMVFGRERHTPAQPAPDMGGFPARGLRTPDYLYIRNFAPQKWPAGGPGDGETNYPKQWYSDCDGGPSKAYIIHYRERDPQHRWYYELCFARRPAEELYDLRKDPGQVDNVAGKAEYQATLEKMRIQLTHRLEELGDPRARDPGYTGFDDYPYLGGGGGRYQEAP